MRDTLQLIREAIRACEATETEWLASGPRLENVAEAPPNTVFSAANAYQLSRLASENGDSELEHSYLQRSIALDRDFEPSYIGLARLAALTSSNRVPK